MLALVYQMAQRLSNVIQAMFGMNLKKELWPISSSTKQEEDLKTTRFGMLQH